ncbi:uncharacterized protein PV07_07521 [Cladophialophora immunda]|uniref:Rhodopsin domain-containing protein n=1 Tax=Cladophialophora immunda TaxID=569365 RepID=A0A0D2C9Q0_9EURO|nr:uncharacterized protein PV07_07521 [Cladophialophora immunda]KIW27818.1 hypothetical protein PV07_07521 [Cladophialophora immunda]
MKTAAGLPPNPHGQRLAHVSIIMCTIAGFLVICRLLVRFLVHRRTGWDDYTLIISLALAIGMTVCFNMEVYYGMGLHTKQLDAHNKVLAFEWLWVAQLLYKFANGMTKITIVLLYLRIFPTRKFKILAWSVIGYVVAYCTAAVCTSIWQCDPIEKAWKKTLPGHCIDIGKLWYANSVLTIVADLVLIAMPVNQIVRLKLPLSQKLGLIFVFSLGVFVMACTIIRCVMLGPTTSQKDSVYYQAESNSWTFLEVDVSIICASLPLLKTPLQRLLPQIFGMKSSSAKSDGYYHGNAQKSSGRGAAIPMNNRAGRPRGPYSDAASDEEQILESGAGIMKTTKVTLEYEEAEITKDLADRKPRNGTFDFGLQS